MNYDNQRKLAKKLFSDKLPKDVLKSFENGCFPIIIKELEPFRKTVLKVIKDIEILSEWAYCWARDIGNRKIMCNRVVDKEYIELWLENIPSYHGIMRRRLRA
ncbi:MAG: hypothetical protein PVG39_25070 [Desulfobacteraceae bacterium]